MKKYIITFKTNNHFVICCDNIEEKDLIGDGNISLFFIYNNVTIGNVNKNDILTIDEF